jgi:hypothetical protein
MSLEIVQGSFVRLEDTRDPKNRKSDTPAFFFDTEECKFHRPPGSKHSKTLALINNRPGVCISCDAPYEAQPHIKGTDSEKTCDEYQPRKTFILDLLRSLI